MSQKNGPTALVILDGFGYSPIEHYNAINSAQKPHFNYFLATYPHAILEASGPAVGLLPDVMGNSEVGHLTLGCGRVIPQSSVIIRKAIDNHILEHNPILMQLLEKLVQSGKTLHIMGLLSDGNVHADEHYMHALFAIASKYAIAKIVLHVFLDGRDVLPQSAALYLQRLDAVTKNIAQSSLGSLHGRFFAMDRDRNWERTYESYKVLTQPQEVTFKHWTDVLAYYYQQQITDEFIPPTQLDQQSIIQSGDGIIMTNYRPDRIRQLTASFVQKRFNHFPTQPINLAFFITPVDYNDPSIQTTVLFEKQRAYNTLKDVLSAAGKRIFSIAETEKYAHVTYFFNGGRQEPVAHEKQVLIPSIPTKNYAELPCMSAPEITKTVLQSLQKDPYDFYLINYANADMVGHSGNFEATVKAIECLDDQLQQLYETIVVKMNGTLYITGDHGNAEQMYDAVHHQPKTSHTTNPVYCIMIKKGLEHSAQQLPLQTLADIAPYILETMNVPIPVEMKR